METSSKAFFLPAPSNKQHQKLSTAFDVFDTSFQSAKANTSLSTVDKAKKTVKLQRTFDTSLFEDKEKDLEEEKVLKKPKIDFSTKLSGILPPPKQSLEPFKSKSEQTKKANRDESDEEEEGTNNFFSFLPSSRLSSFEKDQSDDEEEDTHKQIKEKNLAVPNDSKKEPVITGSAKIAKGISLGLSAYDDSDSEEENKEESANTPSNTALPRPSILTPPSASFVTKSHSSLSNKTKTSSSTASSSSSSYANQLPRKLGPNKPALPPLQSHSLKPSYPEASSVQSILPSASPTPSTTFTIPSSHPTLPSFDNLPTPTPGPSVAFPPDSSFEMYPEIEPEDPLLSRAAQEFGSRYLSAVTSGQAQVLEIDQKQLLPPPSTAAKIIKVHEPTIHLPIGMMPGKNSRRRHQITYLAFEAKQRELEFAEKKAQSLKTKSEVQAKYGW